MIDPAKTRERVLALYPGDTMVIESVLGTGKKTFSENETAVANNRDTSWKIYNDILF